MKAGIKTTEFWLTVLTNLLAVIGVLEGVLPAQTAAVIVAVLNGIYGVLRALQKAPEITTVVER